LRRDTDYSPSTSIETGVKRFVEWYTGFYGK
jgi:UDP-glucuronate 4-epimerase